MSAVARHEWLKIYSEDLNSLSSKKLLSPEIASEILASSFLSKKEKNEDDSLLNIFKEFQSHRWISKEKLSKILSRSILKDESLSKLFEKSLKEIPKEEEGLLDLLSLNPRIPEERLLDLLSLSSRIHQFVTDVNGLLTVSLHNPVDISMSNALKFAIALDKYGKTENSNKKYALEGHELTVTGCNNHLFLSIPSKPIKGSFKKVDKLIWYRAGEGSSLLAKAVLRKKPGKKVNVNELEKEKEFLSLFNGCEGILPMVEMPIEVSSLFKEKCLFTKYHIQGDLLDYCERHAGKFSSPEYVEKANKIALSLLKGMHHLHQKNVIHRDIKPENILIDALFRAVLSDFGLAKFLLKEKIVSFSGSLFYLSPEIIYSFLNKHLPNENNTGKASDVWALGLCLYILYVGKLLPWMKFEPKQIYKYILEESNILEFQDQLKKERLDKNIQKIILSMLTYDPLKRAPIEEVLKKFEQHVFTIQKKTVYKETSYGDFLVECEAEMKEREGDIKLSQSCVKVQLKDKMGIGIVKIDVLALAILKKMNIPSTENNIEKLKSEIEFYSKKNEVDLFLFNYKKLVKDL